MGQTIPGTGGSNHSRNPRVRQFPEGWVKEVRNIHQELSSLKDALTTIPNCYALGKLDRRFNKVECLSRMIEYGLNVPPNLVTGKKADLVKFIATHREVIVKPLGDGRSFAFREKVFKIYTEKIDKLLDDMDENFFPSLFQKYIQKKLEIRSFYIEGKIFSMGIFSQQNLATQIDQRHHKGMNPNRRVPFKLPIEVEQKIREFMRGVKISMGVFDIIKGNGDEYTFLELNPFGQFGDISKCCNYFLEREVAHVLNRRSL